jgi:SNF family Na+-dependent transporter
LIESSFQEIKLMKTQALKYTTGILCLIATWLALFFVLSFFTSLILAPWDTAIDMPEVGTLARTANDYFATSPGASSIAIVLLIISLSLTIPALRKRLDTWYQFAGTNLMCLAALLLVFAPAAMINNNILFPYPPVMYDPNYNGYHRSVFPGLVILVVCIGWLLWQRRIRQSAVNLP